MNGDGAPVGSGATVEVGAGRRLAVDTTGAPGGRPVLYLHGTPDSRLSRHPDGDAAARLGVEVLAVDRPGIGRSDPDPGRGLASVADDLATVLATTTAGRAGVVAWSAGAPYAVALAVRHAESVGHVVLVAPAVPITAYADPAVLDAGGPGRALFAEMASELPADEVASEVAPYMLPDPATPESVAALLDAETDAGRAADLAAAGLDPGHLVRATSESVARGRAGLMEEVAVQAAAPDVDLSDCTVPVTIVSGSLDEASPPAFGRWWADLLPHAEHRVVDGAGHAVVLREWANLLATAVSTP